MRLAMGIAALALASARTEAARGSSAEKIWAYRKPPVHLADSERFGDTGKDSCYDEVIGTHCKHAEGKHKQLQA
jgi:hypothetical protein